MNYSDFINVNKNFQASINLELDLGKEDKIDEYVPTTDICDVIKRYVKVFLGESKDYSTTLVGPYGKGKSFLLLILSFLVGKNKDGKTWTNLVNKIKKVDDELYEMLLRLKEKEVTLLPILINSNYDNITQSFQLALNDALKREKLTDIIPDSIFDVCLELLNKWMIKDGVREGVLSKCLEVNKINLDELKKGLMNFSPIAYKQFGNLYNCINIGLDFNPLINNDIVKTYSNIASSLNAHGYTGIFIIFDEFSKFLESNSSDLMKDLKIVQDFAELAARSSNKTQIHFCCITHKSIGLYKNDKKQSTVVDSFKTVEGRFKEIRFNRSLNENYQIISAAIVRRDGYLSQVHEYLKTNNDFIQEMINLPVLNKDEKLKNIIFNECFPLNPLTVYSLIQVSELVAQNERTLFTFLSDTDDDSFNSFIHSASEGLFDVDKIYDYFGQLFRKEENGYIRNIWYRTESILSKLDDIIEKRIIKTLSIILIVGNPDDLPANNKILSLSTELDDNTINKRVNSLIERHYLRKNPLSNQISFALSSSKQIDEAVAVLKKTKCKNLRFSDLADQVNEKKYILPRKYNEINKITRFYKVAFFTEEDFARITSFNYYFETNYCDGLVIYLLKDKLSKKSIDNVLSNANDRRVIVKYPTKPINNVFYDSLATLESLKEFKKQKGIDEITQGQVDLIIEETKSDLFFMINDYFEDNFEFSSIAYDGKSSFNQLLSNIMESIYNVKLIFNNELVNKKDVTSQYQKAVNHVIDWILNGQGEFPYSETSPENSVKIAIIDNNSANDESSMNVRKILDDLKTRITDSEGEKKTIKEIVSRLSLSPYGIKNGIIPVIFAKAISELSDNAIVYYQQKEVELDSSNIVKAINNDKYQISFAKGSSDQNEYLGKMLDLFGVKKENNFRKDVSNLANGIKRFFIGMPQVIRLCNKNNNFLELEPTFIEYKNLFLTFDINPHEVVFEKPALIFKTRNYAKIFNEIKKIVGNENRLLNVYKKKLISLMKNIFAIEEETSIRSGFDDFISNSVKEGSKPILEDKDKVLYSLVTTDLSYDDLECLEKLSKAITGQHIEDWDSDKTDLLSKRLKEFKSAIATSSTVSESSDNLSSLLSKIEGVTGVSSLLKNNLESVLEEFSGSVSSQEKMNVLLSILKDLL